MMEKRQEKTLKWRLFLMVLLCWLLPVLMILGTMGFYIYTSLGTQTAESLEQQLAVNTRMCAERVDSAIEASRLLSRDPTIKNAYTAYRDGTGEEYPALYSTTRALVDRQYRSDSRFRFVVFFYRETPNMLNVSTFNESAGVKYDQVKNYWEEDHQTIFDISADMGTAISFVERSGTVYLLRNVVDQNYTAIGTAVMALNLPYFFSNLNSLPWASSVAIELGGTPISLTGDTLPLPETLGFWRDQSGIRWKGQNDSWLYSAQGGLEYPFSTLVQVDYRTLLREFTSYQYLLAGMGILLVLILLFFFRFFQRQVSEPIRSLMLGAAAVEEGNLGYQLEERAESREFSYLIASFNQMSNKLEYQFNHIFEEELALRDARIKALQSHINPHFMNNTLEIINWEARLAGNAKVSKMIEALSTVLDAAIDREKRPEVRLGEEIAYVSSYLYIIGERFGQRLHITQEIAPETLEFMVPRLILQPVIENAVEHGIGPAGKGEVSIRSRLEDGRLILEITNDGGLSREDRARIDRLLAPNFDASHEPSKNMGISNVNQRLRILYGGESGLTITAEGENRVVARLIVAGSAN